MWYSKYLKLYDKPFSEVSDATADEIRRRIEALQSDEPLVTVSVIAYNEERHLASCLWSLAESRCKYPMEIIGIDNDSKDRTAEVFERLGVRFFRETEIHSCGGARLCGLKNARGKYHINIDADTMYPAAYVEKMVDALERKDTVGVTSLWSYMPDEQHSRAGLFFYELVRDFYLWILHFKRPELSVRGLVFGYNTELARKVGIRTDIIRGEDGSLALGLKQYGKLRFIRSRKARAVTGYGTVGADGSLLDSFVARVRMRLGGLPSMLRSKSHYRDEDSNLVK